MSYAASPEKPRKIIHVDMDCFYAACEIKQRPELRGKAIGIGGPPNSRSVLCTANYEARKFDVRSAMPSSQAVRLCPHLILIPPNFELYRKESLALREILGRFSSKIEPLSLDEAFIDVTDSPHFGGSATLIAREIRSLVQRELSLTASAGVAPNKFLAKVASDWRKPDGLFVVRPEQVASFVEQLKVEKIYGVGKVTAKRMHELGLVTCADIQKQSVDQLVKWFGSRGESLYRIARGIDHRIVEPHYDRKSLSVEETFHKDLPNLDACLKVLPSIFEDWQRRMKKGNTFERIRGHVVKIKFFDFKSTTHELSSRQNPGLGEFEELFVRAWTRHAKPVRLIGLGARLVSAETEDSDLPRQLTLAI